MSKRSLVILAALAILSEPAWAQTPAGGQFLVNTYTTGVHFSGPVSAAPNGDFVILWTSGGTGGGEQDGSLAGAFGRRFDAGGAAQGPEFRANTYTTGGQYSYGVAVDGAGNFVVVWTSPDQDGSGSGIFAQRYDSTGTARGQELRVNTHTLGYQRRPGVAVDAAGNVVVAWESDAQDGSDLGIFGQRYDASGAPRGGEFQINTYTTGMQYGPAVGADPAGNFVVAWSSTGQDGSSYGVFARRFDSSGVPQGAEFTVNSHTTGAQGSGRVTVDGQGNFVVSWSGEGAGDGYGVFARRFDGSGAPLGPDFRVNTTTHNQQFVNGLDADSAGNFAVTWGSFGQDGNGWGVFGQRYRASGVPLGIEFLVNSYSASDEFGSGVAVDAVGNMVIVWSGTVDGITSGVFAQRYGGLYPAALDVDAAGNRVLEPGETVTVSPSWRNLNGASQAFAGAASSFTGPGAPTNPAYSIPDAAADYGTVANAATGSCASTGNCYSMATTLPTSRPHTHWDAAFQEDILPVAQGQSKSWTLHVGGSFTDVSTTSPFYRSIEALLHNGVTAGCTFGARGSFCPAAPVTRDQMAPLLLMAREGSGYSPAPCIEGAPLFADVPASNSFCRWIEELARRGIVTGCGGGNYCPTLTVSREEMALLVLLTLDPTLNPPACSPPNIYNDVPESSPFCRWIEELANRGAVADCGGGNYCPTADVNREQMAVFLTVTFGLLLYGP